TSIGNKVRGAQYFREAVQADPSDVEGIFLLGRFAMEQGDWAEAIVAFDAAARASTGKPRAMELSRLVNFHLGTALAEEGYVAAAVEQYSTFLRPHLSSAGGSGPARELAVIESQSGITWQ